MDAFSPMPDAEDVLAMVREEMEALLAEPAKLPAEGEPAPLSPLTSAVAVGRTLSRRTALCGSVAASLGLLAGAASAQAAPTLSSNDRQLVELADAYEALDRRCIEHSAAHRHDLTNAADAEFGVLASGFGPLEEACAATPADSLVGVLAKARLCRSPTARGCAENEHAFSIADDLCRLHDAGRLTHG